MFGQYAAFLSPVATYVLLASLKGTVAIGFVLLCRKLFATWLPPQFRHYMWLAVVASLIAPIGFDLPIKLQGPVSAAQPSVELLPAALPAPALSTPAASHPRLATGAPNSVRTSGISIRQWLVLLWATMVIALAAVLAFNLQRIRRIAAQATPVSGAAHDLLLLCKTQMGVRRGIRLLESPTVMSPAVFGWLAPTLLLPRALQDRSHASQLRHVFLHELAHVKRHDILTNWIMTAAQILHWFNPVVWYGLRGMRSDMEQATDVRVLRHLELQERAAYGHTLIAVLEEFPAHTPAHGLGVVESHAQLKERIRMITHYSSPRIGSPVLAAVLLLGLASIAATQLQVNARPADSSAEREPNFMFSADRTVLLAQIPQSTPASPVAPPRATASTPPVTAASQSPAPANPAPVNQAPADQAQMNAGIAARDAPPNDVATNDIIPSDLLRRMDVVTGGASATYGSGAMAGVVNLVLNNRLAGFRLDMDYGSHEAGNGSRLENSELRPWSAASRPNPAAGGANCSPRSETSHPAPAELPAPTGLRNDDQLKGCEWRQ